MTISANAFRDALRHFPAGVTLVTLKAAGEVHGLTVSAFVSVSPDPPLIAVIIDHKHRAHQLLEPLQAWLREHDLTPRHPVVTAQPALQHEPRRETPGLDIGM